MQTMIYFVFQITINDYKSKNFIPSVFFLREILVYYAYAFSVGSDEPVQKRSLDKAFAVRKHKAAGA